MRPDWKPELSLPNLLRHDASAILKKGYQINLREKGPPKVRVKRVDLEKKQYPRSAVAKISAKSIEKAQPLMTHQHSFARSPLPSREVTITAYPEQAVHEVPS